MDALRAGFTDVAEVLIQEHKADVLKEDVLGRTPLHLAAQAGCQNSVTFLLLQHSVPVDVRTHQHGLTAMHFAAKEGHVQVITALAHHQANINQQDSKGRTALHIAVGSNKVECVQVLLNCGAIQVVDKAGNTPSQLTTNPKILQLLQNKSKSNQNSM